MSGDYNNTSSDATGCCDVTHAVQIVSQDFLEHPKDLTSSRNLCSEGMLAQGEGMQWVDQRCNGGCAGDGQQCGGERGRLERTL